MLIVSEQLRNNNGVPESRINLIINLTVEIFSFYEEN